MCGTTPRVVLKQYVLMGSTGQHEYHMYAPPGYRIVTSGFALPDDNRDGATLEASFPATEQPGSQTVFNTVEWVFFVLANEADSEAFLYIICERSSEPDSIINVTV